MFSVCFQCVFQSVFSVLNDFFRAQRERKKLVLWCVFSVFSVCFWYVLVCFWCVFSVCLMCFQRVFNMFLVCVCVLVCFQCVFSVCFAVFFVKMLCFARSAKKIFLVLQCVFSIFSVCFHCVFGFSVFQFFGFSVFSARKSVYLKSGLADPPESLCT